MAKITLIVLTILAGVLIVAGFVLFLRRWRGSGNLSMPIGAVAEAEMLIVYGRRAEAIELLEKALHANPARQDIARKLRRLKQE